MSIWKEGAAVLTFTVSAAVAAHGQEYCVACTEPAAVYRCVIQNAAPSGVPLKDLCIGRMTKDGGHKSCAVRAGTVFDCNGPVRKVDVAAPARANVPAATQRPDAAPQDAAAAQGNGEKVAAPPGPEPGVSAGFSAPAGQPAQGAQTTAPPAKTTVQGQGQAVPPKTMEALAKEMGKSSSEAFGKAGEASKKAWECMTSFFSRCK